MDKQDVAYRTPDPQQLPDGTPSALEQVPGEFLAGLLSGAKDAGDPAQRDYSDRYSFVRVLGEGGQGVVVSARDNLLGREVAIKALKAPFEPSREEHLEREAKICGLLEHPNILPTYDLCWDETGSPFFVMKQIEGVSLEEMLKDSHTARQDPNQPRGAREVSQRRLLNIFVQVCRAIEYAHSRGVYHLDLKPQNIKVGPFGEVYVLDWGFAAREEDDHKYIAGTPIYIAPERLRGGRPDPLSDVYSLGVMLYRILTGRLPRDVGSLTFSQYRERVGELPVIPPRTRNRTIPHDLEAIVLKAMADAPGERYANVRALADDLERFLDILPVTAYQEGLLGRSWKFVRRHKGLAIMAAIVFFAFGVVGLVLWRNHVAETRTRELQLAAEAARERQRIRGRARIPLEKAVDMVEQRRVAVENAESIPERRAILAPAFTLFRQAIEIDPSYADAYYQRGKAHYLAREDELALADFQRACQDGSFIMAHYWAGKIYADVMKDNEAALREFESIQDEANEYSELGMARMDLAAGRFDAALERCDRILAVNPAMSEVWYIRGLIYQSSEKHQDFSRARAAYDCFLAQRRDNPSAFQNRGDIRLRTGDVDGAIADYQAALNANPRYKWALTNLGYVLYQHKKKPLEGLGYIEKALKIDPDYVWGYMGAGAIYEYLRQHADAERAYTEAHRRAPDDPDIWYRKGLFYLNTLRLEKAEEAFNATLAKLPENPGSQPRRARTYHCRAIARLARNIKGGGRDYADVVRDFEESIRLRQEGKIYPALLRWIALKLSAGEPVDSADFATQLEAPADKPWLAAIGSFYLGDCKEAEVLDLAKTPESQCEVYFYLGAYALVRKEQARAAAHFQAALKTDIHLYLEYTLARVFLDAGGARDLPTTAVAP